MVYPVVVGVIEVFLILLRKPALKFSCIAMMGVPVRSCDSVEGRVGRNLVARHDRLHLSGMLVDLMAIILGIGFLPFVVILVEFLLIVGRHPGLILSRICTIVIAIAVRRRIG